MRRITSFFIVIFFSPSIFLSAQDIGKIGSITVETIGSVFFGSQRWATLNENNDGTIYGELRIGFVINNYLEANVFTGYAKRYFGYFAQNPNGSLYLLNMERYYVPVGINIRLYLSDFFFEKLKLWKKQGRWDIYNQVGFAVLKGKDVRDTEGENFYKNLGYYVPYYFYPYVQWHGKKYLVYLAGVRYNSSDNFGIFLEGGQGAFTDLQIGLKAGF